MKNWMKFLLPTLLVLAVAGVRIGLIWKDRHDADKPIAQSGPKLTQDQLAVDRQLEIINYAGAEQLVGKPVWVRAGFLLVYYPYRNEKVVFQRVGELGPGVKLNVVRLTEQAVPSAENNRVPHGTKQGFVVFTFGGTGENPSGQFAAPIGFEDGTTEQYFADQLFFYDDPHGIYDHWPKQVWNAIDAHTPQVGMNELQVRMAVGQQMKTDSSDAGNRTVDYQIPGKVWTVSFTRDKATAVSSKTSR